MKRAVTHRLDDTYIEKAWKHTEMEEIENLALGGHLKTGQLWTGQNRPVGERSQA
jgi:hypothetical protein